MNSWEGNIVVWGSTNDIMERIIDKTISWEFRVKTQELEFLV